MASDTSAKSASWELTLYEMHRRPQELLTDQTEVTVSARKLKAELSCPICLDLLDHTTVTKECLHRFCAECIAQSLRAGNKECPTCRKKLVSRRSLRPDPNFDGLIAKLFPEKVQERERLQREIAEANKATKRKKSGVAGDDSSSTTASEPQTPAPPDSASAAEGPEAKRARVEPTASSTAVAAEAEQPEAPTAAAPTAASPAAAAPAAAASAAAAPAAAAPAAAAPAAAASAAAASTAGNAAPPASEHRPSKRTDLKGLFVELFVKAAGMNQPFRERHLKSQADAKVKHLLHYLAKPSSGEAANVANPPPELELVPSPDALEAVNRELMLAEIYERLHGTLPAAPTVAPLTLYARPVRH